MATVETLKPVDDALPEGFADLAPLLDWALPTERERNARRADTPIETLRQVYEQLRPRVEAIMRHLDTFEYGKPLPAAEEKLFHLALALMEISHPVELGWKQGLNPNGFPVSRLNLPHRD